MPENWERVPERAPQLTTYRGCAFPGNPGRPTAAQRRARVEGIADKLAAEYGGLRALTAVERLLMLQAAELSLRRPLNCEDAVRIANATQRALAKLSNRKRAPDRPRPLAAFLQSAKP
jgi:hypothetical protein